MTTSSQVAVRALRPISAALLVAGMLIGSPAQVTAGGATNQSESSAGIHGSVGCTNFGDTTGCTQWEHVSPEGVRVFAATDERTKDGDLSKAEVRFTETFAVDGTLKAVSISGRVQTSNHGGGRAIAQAHYDVTLNKPEGDIAVSGNATATFSGSELIVSDVDLDVDVDCEDDTYVLDMEGYAGGDAANSNSKNASFSETVDSSSGYCSISVYAWVDSATNRPAPGETGQTDMRFQMTISIGAQPTGCDGLSITGKITDGFAERDGHDNPLRGVRVELRRDGQRVGVPVATNEYGTYCIRADGSPGIEPGDFQLRATLIDVSEGEPLFETRHATDGEAVWAQRDIHAENFEPENSAHLDFGSTPEKEWLADVANIHWQSERFVRWIRESLGISGNALGTFTIVAFASEGTSHLASTHVISINSDGTATDHSRYAHRNEPIDEAPENGEWHEIGHHLGQALGIAPTWTAPACANRVSHGGWLNETTCDSLSEGFAMFVATLASLEIDAGGPAGYATSDYAGIADIEENSWRPWSSFNSSGTDYYREDIAVADLLWDLADDTPDESTSILLIDPTDASLAFEMPTHDRVGIGGTKLINLMSEIRPSTVDELYQGLMNSSGVASTFKTIDRDLGLDNIPDISPLQEVFLAHGFHATKDSDGPYYIPGTPVGRTDHQSTGAGLLPRPHIERAPSSNVLLQNRSSQSITVSIDVVRSGSPARHIEVPVPAMTEKLVYLEVPPYWRGILAEGAALPACDAETDYPVTITISAPGETERKLGSCEYLQGVAVATGDAAITFTAGAAGAAGPGPTSAPGIAPAPSPATPLVLIGGAVLLAAVLLVVALVLKRRRRGKASGGSAAA